MCSVVRVDRTHFLIFYIMNKTLILQFLEQINKLNNKILFELKTLDNDKLKSLVTEQDGLTSALQKYIEENNNTEELDKESRGEELLATMSELSKMTEKVIKTLPNLKSNDEGLLNSILTSTAINIVSKVLEISERKQKCQE